MAKKKSKITFTTNSGSSRSAKEDVQELKYRGGEMVQNATLMRRDLLSRLIDPKRDIDKEAGYAEKIDPLMYQQFWEREGIPNRIIRLFPEECWKRDPEVYETEEASKTAFEETLEAVNEKHALWSFMERVDTLSGIGHYGVLLLGLNDGKDLDQPVSGIDEKGLMTKVRPKSQELTFLRAFDEYLAPVKSYEEDVTNPRFGLPKFYTLKFVDTRTGDLSSTRTLSIDKTVHWSRVVHIADNRTTSEVIGTPRLQNIFNYLYDMKKILSGSGEMFWKGGYPGYAFEVAPENVGTIEIDKDSMRREMDAFSNSLQRYMALVGVSAKSLAPQVADPRGHLDVQLDAICIAKAIPKRILMGSEQAQLASTQDKKTWNERLAHRQIRYLTPRWFRPIIDRLIHIGVLPAPANMKYFVEWPEIFSPTDDDVATTAFKRTQAMAQYVGSGAEMLIPPMEYLTMVLKFSWEEAAAIIAAAESHEAQFDDLLDVGNPQEKPPGDADRGKNKDKPKGTTGA